MKKLFNKIYCNIRAESRNFITKHKKIAAI